MATPCFQELQAKSLEVIPDSPFSHFRSKSPANPTGFTLKAYPKSGHSSQPTLNTALVQGTTCLLDHSNSFLKYPCFCPLVYMASRTLPVKCRSHHSVAQNLLASHLTQPKPYIPAASSTTPPGSRPLWPCSHYPPHWALCLC